MGVFIGILLGILLLFTFTFVNWLKGKSKKRKNLKKQKENTLPSKISGYLLVPCFLIFWLGWIISLYYVIPYIFSFKGVLLGILVSFSPLIVLSIGLLWAWIMWRIVNLPVTLGGKG